MSWERGTNIGQFPRNFIYCHFKLAYLFTQMRTLEAISRHAGFGSVSERGEFTSSILEDPICLATMAPDIAKQGFTCETFTIHIYDRQDALGVQD